jgi:hypothetical protein
MGKTPPIEQLQNSCEEHIYYPLNLVQNPLRAQLGHAYLDKLNERATTLFDESKAKLDFIILQYNDGSMFMSTQSAKRGSSSFLTSLATHHVSDFLTSMDEMRQLFPATSSRNKHWSETHTELRLVAMDDQEKNENIQRCSML